jgi:hypothetical protein
MTADVSGVFLNTSDFAESITHRPGGVSANDTAVTVVFIPDEGTTANRKDSSTGEARVSTATIHAATTLAVAAADQFVRNSEVWSVLAIGPDESGMQMIKIQRVDEDRRNTRSRGMR